MTNLLRHICTDDVLNHDNVNAELAKINQNIISLHAKIDHDTKVRSARDTEISSTTEKLNELYNDMKFNSTNSTTRNCQILTMSSAKRRHNRLTHTWDPLNWSFSFNSPSVTADNSDIYQLLHGFEKNTWTSFDYLCSKLTENTDAIARMESTCNDFNSNRCAQPMNSPVMDSIALDNMQRISEKCDNIDRALVKLTREYQSNPDDNVTLHLRVDFWHWLIRTRVRGVKQ